MRLSTSVALGLFALSLLACSRDARSPDGEGRAAPSSPTAEPAPVAVAAGAAEPAASVDASASAEQPMERTPDIEYVPTPENVVEKMLEVGKVKKGDVLYDLGCGDGRIVVTAAKKFGIKAFGFDLDPQRIKESKENAKKAGVEHLVTFEQKDIFNVDLSPATVVTLYLLPELNVRLIPQLEKLKPGSRVVSHDFDMEGVAYENWWSVIARDHQTPKDREHFVYLWKTPLKLKKK
ncbi:MAG: methyltransferase domain-containing protein [Labilithrix sp.]|nr:methyltransferase domain-containing protein [Labilithrix sp.]